MKKYILGGSLGASAIATLFGIAGVVYSHSASVTQANFGTYAGNIAMCYQLAGIFGLLGIASFFVGWVFPSTVSETHVIGDGGATSTRSVVNN